MQSRYDQIMRALDAGTPYEALASRWGTSRRTIRVYDMARRGRLSCISRHDGGHHNDLKGEALEEAVYALINQGKTVEQTARILHKGHSRVSRILTKGRKTGKCKSKRDRVKEENETYRDRILELRREGVTARQIALTLQIDLKIVERIVNYNVYRKRDNSERR